MSPPPSRHGAVLYLTIDGILGHIGFSQVVRVVEGLARRGHRYAIVSLERPSDLADDGRVERVRTRLREAGIDWSWGSYEEGGGAAVIRNQARFASLAVRAVARCKVTHVHARGYHSALVAMGLARPFLFDARGYWIDERVQDGRWFTTPTRLAWARSIERRMFTAASRVVTLTELQAEDVRTMRSDVPASTVVAIPTCADYDEFAPAATSPARTVVGIVGSANRSYMVAETAMLAAAILAASSSAEVLVVSSDQAAWREHLEDHGVPDARIRSTRVPHERMPEALREMSWLLMLLTPETIAKRGSMPTKLAECFASGVRVCAFGCNPEVERWVDQAGGGLVLGDLGAASIADAARHIAAASRAPNLAGRARTESHFSLASGIHRYDEVLQRWTSP